MGRRIFDLTVGSLVLLVFAPIMLLTAAAIRLSDPGPVLYRAVREGQDETRFELLKFRTMRIGSDQLGIISGLSDQRVFPFGAFLRKTKLDELPQFWNVIRGEMSVVGPRPENCDIVERCYTKEQRRTLSVRPGVASPGSIFNYTHAHEYLDDDDPVGSYEQKLLPVKLGLELVYVDDQSISYDLRLIGRTIAAIGGIIAGRRDFPLPREYAIARDRGYIDV